MVSKSKAKPRVRDWNRKAKPEKVVYTKSPSGRTIKLTSRNGKL